MASDDINEWAVVRLATIQDRGKPGRLVFATVMLLPPGRPAPPSMNKVDHIRLKKTDESVFFRRTTLSSADAILWYRSLGSGVSKTPVPTKYDERDNSLDGIEITVPLLSDNPNWPHLGLPFGESLFAHPEDLSHPAPFVGCRPARVHRRFGRDEDFGSLTSNDRAMDFIARRMHIDMRTHPEYLGSASLVSPDPIIRQIEHFMIPAGASTGERILYRIVARTGQSLQGLRITTFDVQDDLLTNFETLDVPPDGIVDVDKGSCTGKYGYLITHPSNGILAYSPPYGFLRQIGVNIHAMPTAIKRINVPTTESPSAKRMEYVAGDRSLTKRDPSTLIGLPPPGANIAARIAEAKADRRKRSNGELFGQRWFPNGSREAAIRFVHTQIGSARSRILIADPYLSALQIGQFLYAINGSPTDVRLLTSSLAFSSGPDGIPKAEHLKSFIKRLDELKDQHGIDANAYVIQASTLHDRFLVIDNAVWFLGNSLNSLGDRSSLIVKVPNPGEVIDHLSEMQHSADNLRSYAAAQLLNSEGDSV